MREEGFIKISRRLLDWEHSDNLALTGFWLHLLLRASWEDTKRLKRGELYLTYDGIACECCISRETVRRYLNILKESGEIETETDHRRTKVRIVNWDRYQQALEYTKNMHTDVHTDVYTAVHTDVPAYPYIKEIKNIRREEESTHFSDFWDLYPKKTGKQKAEEEWQRILSTGETDPADIVSGLETIVSKQWGRWPENEKRYIPAPARWLQEHRWTDEPDEYVPKGTAKKVKKEPAYMKELEELMKKDRDLL